MHTPLDTKGVCIKRDLRIFAQYLGETEFDCFHQALSKPARQRGQIFEVLRSLAVKYQSFGYNKAQISGHGKGRLCFSFRERLQKTVKFSYFRAMKPLLPDLTEAFGNVGDPWVIHGSGLPLGRLG